MISRIREQILTIERDRDRLKELNEQEKRFFDNMTHELKTPLTSIQGYAEIIKDKGESDRAFFDKGMNHIVEESRRLHNLVIKLLEVSREPAKGAQFSYTVLPETSSIRKHLLKFPLPRPCQIELPWQVPGILQEA